MKVTQAEFARICSVNRSTVSRWVQDGRIEVDTSGLIDPQAAQAMRLATESPAAHHQARKAQFDEAREAKKAATTAFDGADATHGAADAAQAPQSPENSPETASAAMQGAEKLGMALKMETYKLQKAKAERENMEIDKMAGALVDRSEVDYVLADLGNTLRSLLEGLPDRLASRIAAVAGNVSAIHKTLEESMHDALGEMSANIKRKAEGLHP
jgi:phage terminase Nu1 subunit (DNA packaging protein)